MQHWFAYHSQNAMAPYGTASTPGMYLKRHRKDLLIGDLIWVVEGDKSSPARFTLVDCFRYDAAEHPPFPAQYSKFAVRVWSPSSLLSRRIRLNKGDRWFNDLHARYLTKQ